MAQSSSVTYSVHCHRFDELSGQDIYDVLSLRSQVFVVEQRSVYLDTDGQDESAWHVVARDSEQRVVGTARALTADPLLPSFGRVCVAASHRQMGMAKAIITRCMNVIADQCGNVAVNISAQTYLIKGYMAHGFVPFGEFYDEDGLPHIAMRKPARTS